MANRLKTLMADRETQDKLASVGSKLTGRETSEDQNKQDGCGKDGITVYLISHQDREEDRGIALLDRAARNELFRNNPKLIAAAIAHTQREQAKQQGYYQYEDYTVTWDIGFVPFHLCFSVSCPRGSCRHLVSVRNRFLQEPAQYAKAIIPLAKSFIEQPLESNLPHLPFIRPKTQNGRLPEHSVEEETIRRTMEQARFILSKYATLLEIDIQTAEATAKLVNAGKIDPSRLILMTYRMTKTELLQITSETEHYATTKKKKSQIQGLVQPAQAAIMNHKLSSSAQQQYKDNEPILNKVFKDDQASEGVKEVVSVEEKVPSIVESLKVHRPKTKKKPKKKSRQKSAKRGKATQLEEFTSKEAEPLLETSFSKASKGGKLPTTPPNDPLEAPLLEPTLLTKTVSDELFVDEEIRTADHAKPIEPYEASRPSEEIIITDMPPQKISAPCLPSSPFPSDHCLERTLVGPSPASRNASGPKNNLTKGGTQLKLCTSFDETTSQPQPKSESPPIDESFPHDSGYSSPVTDVKPAVSRGLQGLKWTYATRTEADADLLQAGVWLWNKPRGYLQSYRVFNRETYHHTTLFSVFISHQSTGDAQPIIEYDGMRIHIVPHAMPWPDLRATPGHPDFLVPCKLVEYQACEAAGYRISRHNRSFLYCRKTGCDVQVVDDNLSSCICPGCGPKTAVRYCSFQHLAEDVKDHWQECGHPDLVISSVIDHVAVSSNSYREYPAIKEKHGIRSAARQLQQMFARYHKGHYTLFYPCSLKAQTLSWPEADPNAVEMDGRIERLLNIAFLDTYDYHVLSYLYRLFRHLLITAGEWDFNTQSALNTQFSMEFDDGLLNTLTFSSPPPCECEWFGQNFQQYESHLAVCSLMPKNGFGSTSPVLGLRAYVERLESRYWILRASRQQHSTEEFWQRRAAGHGFPRLSPRLKTFTLGPGWTGWGGKEDDICLPDESS